MKTYPSRTPEGRRAYRKRVAKDKELEVLIEVQSQTRIQIYSDRINGRVRVDLIDIDGDILARCYLSKQRTTKLVAALSRAALDLS